MQSKAVRKGFERRLVTREERIGRKLHGDLCGPFRVRSYQQSKYYAVIVDDRSRFKWILFLRHKSDFTQLFKDLTLRIMNEKGTLIKTFQTDQGGEFINDILHQYLKSFGCHLQTSIARTSEQNGVSERAIRVITEGIRSLLIDANLPMCYWEDAASYFVYVLNRTYSKATVPANQTPFQAFYGTRPDVSNLPLFGTACFYHLDRKLRHKLEPTAREGRFIGFPTNMKGYKILDLKSRSIHYSRSVTFQAPDSWTNPIDLVADDVDNMLLDPDEDSSADEYDPARTKIMDRFLAALPTKSGENSHHKRKDLENKDTSSRPTKRSTLSTKSGITPSRRSQRESHPPDRFTFEDVAAHTIIEGTERIKPLEPETYEMICQALEMQLTIQECYKADDEDFPKTLKDAMSRSDRKQWWKATQSEYKALLDNNTWDLVEISPQTKTIGTRWVYVVKYDQDGNVERYKARLVAQGFTQKLGINYGEHEVYAPVASFPTIRLLIAIAIKMGAEIEQMDINSAYLNGFINRDVYLRLPEGYDSLVKGQYTQETKATMKKKRRALKLKRTLYGLKQAGRLWNEEFNRRMIENGYRRLEADQSIYTKIIDNKLVIVALYVDDLLIIAMGMDTMIKVKDELKSLFSMKEMGPVHWLLGMKIIRNRVNGSMLLAQPAHVDKILKSMNMEHCKPVDTPMVPANRVPDNLPPMPKDFPYRRIVGKLLFIAMATRPDICTAVSYLSSAVSDPTNVDYYQLKRVVRYLKGTRNLGLLFVRSGTPNPQWRDIFKVYADASYADCIKTRRSRTGIVMEFNGTPILWLSKKQSIVAISTMEAEYIAASFASQLTMFIRGVLKDLGFDLKGPTTLFEDNKACIDLANNPETSQRSKHIDVRFHYIRDHVRNQNIILESCPTSDMKADLLTKPLERITFEKLRNSMNMTNLLSDGDN